MITRWKVRGGTDQQHSVKFKTPCRRVGLALALKNVIWNGFQEVVYQLKVVLPHLCRTKDHVTSLLVFDRSSSSLDIFYSWQLYHFERNEQPYHIIVIIIIRIYSPQKILPKFLVWKSIQLPPMVRNLWESSTSHFVTSFTLYPVTTNLMRRWTGGKPQVGRWPLLLVPPRCW